MPVLLSPSRLKVSLTKHGAHKLAKLIEVYSGNEILQNNWGVHDGIKVDRSQIAGILSVDKFDEVPKVWDELKLYGTQDIQDVVLIAIVFSHFKLIECLINGNKNNCEIINGQIIEGKSFTNFAHILDQFSFSIEHTPKRISYDLSRIFYKPYLTTIIREVIYLKLRDAGLAEGNDDLNGGIELRFHEALGLGIHEYKKWLKNSKRPPASSISKVKAPRNFKKGIKFKSGHSSKFQGTSLSASQKKENLLTYKHNKMQNALYKILDAAYPNQIGTEVPTNSGSIDIAHNHGSVYTLYEIKTANSCRENIRQGLSQVLEYAFWNNDISIRELVIIGPAKCCLSSQKYLELLRCRFGLPIYYQEYSMENETLGAKQ